MKIIKDDLNKYALISLTTSYRQVNNLNGVFELYLDVRFNKINNIDMSIM